MQRALIVVQPEKQRPDGVGRRFVPPEPGDDAVGGPGVLDLEHRALAGLIRGICRLGDDAVETGAFEALEPLGRDTSDRGSSGVR